MISLKQCSPKQGYSEISPIMINGSYSRVTMVRTTTKMCLLFLKCYLCICICCSFIQDRSQATGNCKLNMHSRQSLFTLALKTHLQKPSSLPCENAIFHHQKHKKKPISWWNLHILSNAVEYIFLVQVNTVSTKMCSSFCCLFFLQGTAMHIV